MTDPGDVRVTTVADGVARVEWPQGQPIEDVQAAVAEALAGHDRVEAWVDPDDTAAQRVATWSGLRREGVMRGGVTVEAWHPTGSSTPGWPTDLPAHEPEGFRALLNSFLPRKRAISQMLIRDARRTGAVVPAHLQAGLGPARRRRGGRRVAAARGRPRGRGGAGARSIPAGRLLLTDWLPPWSGWDDALCLVFDGGEHDPSILDEVVRQEREIRDAAFCTVEEVRERCADFTARRVEAALANLAGGAPAYTESGIG